MEKSLTDIEGLLHAMQAQSQCCAFCIQMHVPLLFVRTDVRTWDLVDTARGLWLISDWKTSLSILKASLEWTLNLQSNGQSNWIDVNFPPNVVFCFHSLETRILQWYTPPCCSKAVFRCPTLEFKNLFSFQTQCKLGKHSRGKGEKGRPNGHDIWRSFL